jgi:hypothetical protein
VGDHFSDAVAGNKADDKRHRNHGSKFDHVFNPGYTCAN